MSNIKNLIICNHNIPLLTLDQILKDKAGIESREQYDVVSFPNLSKILSSTLDDKHMSMVKHYMLYMIGKMPLLHSSISKIIMIFPHHKNTSTSVYENLFPHLKPTKLIVAMLYPEIHNNILHFYNTKTEYDVECSPILNFICSDGRLSRIYVDSLENPKNPIKANNGYNIRLPGSTLWTTLSEERKLLIDIIVRFIHKKEIRQIFLDHHGPDCGAFCSYHRVEENDPKRSEKQHKDNLEKVWEIFSRVNHLDIFARYFEFNKHFIKEYVYSMNANRKLDFAFSKSTGFDFNNFEFIEKEKVLT